MKILKSMVLFGFIATISLGCVACGTEANETENKTAAYSLDLTKQASTWKTGSKDEVSYRYLENIVYCENPKVKGKQCLNIYAPNSYFNEDGSINSNGKQGDYTSSTAPILYINSVGSYLGKVPYKISDTTTIEGTSGYYYDYINEGYVIVMAGARGRSDYDNSNNNLSLGKAPIGLADLKAGIRFVKGNKDNLPGDTTKIISSGMSAGGAMSILIATSGNSTEFDTYLKEMGANMEETDDVYASQVYCPITDLNHADLAYEWFYETDTSYDSKMTDFQKALSDELAGDYVTYFNSLNINVDGVSYQIDEGSKSGTFIDYLLQKYQDAKNTYIANGGKVTSAESTALLSINSIVKNIKGRSKTCPSFDSLTIDTQNASAENYVFGSKTSTLTSANFGRHFSDSVLNAIAKLKDAYPTEYNTYYDAYYKDVNDEETKKQVALYNPYTYINANNTTIAGKIRICVGTKDSDTSPLISACLALKLKQIGIDVEYNLIWGIGHDTADTEGGVINFVNSICK